MIHVGTPYENMYRHRYYRRYSTVTVLYFEVVHLSRCKCIDQHSNGYFMNSIQLYSTVFLKFH